MQFFNQFVDKGLLDRLNHVLNSDFGHVTYTEAVEILEKNNDNFDYKVYWGCDLQTEHERYLTEQVFKKPVFVTDYPKEIKAFYMKLNDDGRTVAAMDCLVPGIGEIIGGSEREADFDKLSARMDELGPVSYTHLDVYKRQVRPRTRFLLPFRSFQPDHSSAYTRKHNPKQKLQIFSHTIICFRQIRQNRLHGHPLPAKTPSKYKYFLYFPVL